MNDAYELDELVSAHVHHETYRAYERSNGRTVHVRLLRAEHALRGAVVERFLHVARGLQELEHPSLPGVRVDSDETGIPFVIEESVAGRPLSDLLESFPQGLPLGLATHVLLPLVEALALAHARGVVHGGIEPARVRWLGTISAPLPKLFGFASASADRVAGDPAYCAPESFERAPPTTEGDVFAMGVLLYWLLCGELPFRGAGQRALPRAGERARPRNGARARPLDEVAPQLPASWAALSAFCLELDPVQRCRDAGELLVGLRGCMDERRSAPAANPKTGRPSVPRAAPKRASEPTHAARAERSSITAPRGATASVATVPQVEPGAVHVEPAFAQTQVARSSAPRPSPRIAVSGGHDVPPAQRVSGKPEPASKPPSGTPERRSSARELAQKLGEKAQSAQGDRASRPSDRLRPAARATRSPVPVRPSGSAHAGSRPLARGQTAAAALSAAQLEALHALRAREEEDDDRWLVFFMMLFFMVVLQLGVPLLYEPQMARAQALFGGGLELATAGFTIVVVVATARFWTVRVGAGSMLMRVTSFTMTLVAACVCVLTAARFIDSGGLALASGVARRVLPWGVSFLFLLFALAGALRGARRLGHDFVYGMLMLLLATGSLYGSHRAVFATVLADKKLALELPGTASLFDLFKPAAQPVERTDAPGPEAERGHRIAERHEAGANEAADLEVVTEIGDGRARDQAALQKLRGALPGAPQP